MKKFSAILLTITLSAAALFAEGLSLADQGVFSAGGIGHRE